MPNVNGPVLKGNAVIVFSKAPRPGHVKTRLIPEFGAHKACYIHQQLLEYVIENISSIKDADVYLHCSPDASHNFFQYLKAQYHLVLDEQSEGDLGQRMYSAIKNGLEEYNKVVLIGSDCPLITKTYIKQAFDELNRSDVVFGPAEDGGYVLVAMKKPRSDIFTDIDWGSERVLQQSIEKTQPDIPVLLDTLWDVDRAEDVERFRHLNTHFI